jgi:hypothetical protein
MSHFSWVAAVTATAMLSASVPASAQVVRMDQALMPSASPLVTDVQFRGGHGGVRRLPGGGFRGGGFRGGGFGGGGFGQRRFGGGYGYHRGWRGGRGAAIGAGVAGLAAGALIGGALASQAAPAYGYGYPAYDYPPPPPPVPAGDASDYCAQRYKSYDPGTGTYLGYDGLRHPCP